MCSASHRPDPPGCFLVQEEQLLSSSSRAPSRPMCSRHGSRGQGQGLTCGQRRCRWPLAALRSRHVFVDASSPRSSDVPLLCPSDGCSMNTSDRGLYSLFSGNLTHAQRLRVSNPQARISRLNHSHLSVMASQVWSLSSPPRALDQGSASLCPL